MQQKQHCWAGSKWLIKQCHNGSCSTRKSCSSIRLSVRCLVCVVGCVFQPFVPAWPRGALTLPSRVSHDPNFLAIWFAWTRNTSDSVQRAPHGSVVFKMKMAVDAKPTVSRPLSGLISRMSRHVPQMLQW
jgi:hypothetical protein